MARFATSNMAQSTDLMTAEQLLLLPDDGMRYGLVEGVLHMMSPTGWQHGKIAAKLTLRIGVHVERYQLGQMLAAETGFWIRRDPDTVRAPDIAFVSRERLGTYADEPGFIPFAPDLVGEVVSPSDRPSEVDGKARDWLTAGVRVVLVVDPSAKVVRVYRLADEIRDYREGRIDLDEVLPGFELDVVELFQ